MKVLVVDDSLTMRRILIRTLNQIGYDQIVEAKHGGQALEIIEQGGIDLVFADWNMPVMNGLEMVKRIRSGGHTRLPIILVTTRGARQDIIDAVQAGINNYIVKPFCAESLKEKLDLVLNQID